MCGDIYLIGVRLGQNKNNQAEIKQESILSSKLLSYMLLQNNCHPFQL